MCGCWWYVAIKTSLTFKCLIENLLADFSYSRPLDTYLWKQMMKMNRNITYKWCNIDKKHLLFTKRKCHKFSWLFTVSRCSPSFLKKGFFLGKPYPEIRWPSPDPFYKHGFPRRKPFFRKPKLNEQSPMDTSTLHAILHAQIDLLLGEQRDAVNNHENLWHFLFVNNRCFLSTLYHMCISFLLICIICFH